MRFTHSKWPASLGDLGTFKRLIIIDCQRFTSVRFTQWPASLGDLDTFKRLIIIDCQRFTSVHFTHSKPVESCRLVSLFFDYCFSIFRPDITQWLTGRKTPSYLLTSAYI